MSGREKTGQSLVKGWHAWLVSEMGDSQAVKRGNYVNLGENVN